MTAAAERWEAERPPGALHTPGHRSAHQRDRSKSTGLRRLLDDEPALALRVLTDPRGRVQTGIVAFVEALLRRDMAEFGFVPLIEPDALAYALVRLGESFLYADVLANRQPDVATADRLQQALVEGIRPEAGRASRGEELKQLRRDRVWGYAMRLPCEYPVRSARNHGGHRPPGAGQPRRAELAGED